MLKNLTIYIDFDGTLYNSTIQYQRLLDIFKKYNIDEEYIENLKKEDFYQKERSYDILAKKIIEKNNLNKNILKKVDEIYQEDLVYNDIIPFLKKYYKKYNLILLTKGTIDHQQKKIKASKLSKYFKEIIIAEKDKSSLNIDYSKGIFIDNNPIEIEKFHNAKAYNVIRIKRDNDKYSKLPLTIKNIKEFKDFNELIQSKYIEQIGEKYYE